MGLFSSVPTPCPAPDAYVAPYRQGATHAFVARCHACGHSVKHDDQRGAERIRDGHNDTGEWGE